MKHYFQSQFQIKLGGSFVWQILFKCIYIYILFIPFYSISHSMWSIWGSWMGGGGVSGLLESHSKYFASFTLHFSVKLLRG